MTTIKTLISTVALFAAATVFAQSGSQSIWFPKGDDYGQGSIGKRYAGASFSIDNPHGYTDLGYGTNIGVNIPVVNHIDVSAGVGYSWLNYNYPSYYYGPIEIDQKYTSLNASVTIYNTIENNIKPYIAFNVGQTFAKLSTNHVGHNTNFETWGAVVGAEFPYKWLAVDVSIGYDDDLMRPAYSGQDTFATARLSSWITEKIGVNVGVSFVRPMHNFEDSWVFDAGVRFRF